jgi:hypothetical protein
MSRPAARKGTGTTEKAEAEAVEAALDGLLPVLTIGMPPQEAAKARGTLAALFTLRAAQPGGPARLGEEVDRRLRLGESLSLDGRRRLLQEDALALEVETLSGQVFGIALGVVKDGVQVTPVLKKETRRAVARLGKLNAVLVGRFPHLTPLSGRSQRPTSTPCSSSAKGRGPSPPGSRRRRRGGIQPGRPADRPPSLQGGAGSRNGYHLSPQSPAR